MLSGAMERNCAYLPLLTHLLKAGSGNLIEGEMDVGNG